MTDTDLEAQRQAIKLAYIKFQAMERLGIEDRWLRCQVAKYERIDRQILAGFAALLLTLALALWALL